MQDAALVECFIHGFEPRIDAAWRAMSRALPHLYAVGEGGEFRIKGSCAEDLEQLIRDLDLLGWLAPAPDMAPGTPDHGGTPGTAGGEQWR